MPRLRILFVLADGARARLVVRSPESGAFVTVSEIDARDRLKTLRGELRTSLAGRSLQTGTPERHAVGRDDFLRQAKETFVADVAERAAQVCRQNALQGVFIAAPARLIGPLRDHLGPRVKVTGTIVKDLTKAPDETLGAWLDHPIAV